MNESSVLTNHRCLLKVSSALFSIYHLNTMPLLVILVAYFGRDTQNVISRQVYSKIEGMLLLTLEVSNSFG